MNHSNKQKKKIVGGMHMRSEEELRNCLEGRLKWYQKALEYTRNGIIPPIGFPLPDGDINTWEGAARELKNTLNMMK